MQNKDGDLFSEDLFEEKPELEKDATQNEDAPQAKDESFESEDNLTQLDNETGPEEVVAGEVEEVTEAPLSLAERPVQSGDDGERLTLAHFASHAYLEYAMSVVKGRALPDVGDGQKPVQRRIL